MDKFEITQLHPELYTASPSRVKTINVPPLRILSINGEGEKDGPRYLDSVSALLAVAYGIKGLPQSGFTPEGYLNFNLAALEILYSATSDLITDPNKQEHLQWELFVVVPGFVSQQVVNMAATEVKKHNQNPRIDDVHINELQEKKSVQLLHIGSQATIAKDYDRLLNYITKKGLRPAARYHEIYLDGIDSKAKARPRIIIRQPVVRLG